MLIFIPNIDFEKINKKTLFVITRPFWSSKGWTNQSEEKSNWNISDDYQYTNEIFNAAVYLIPKPINTYTKSQLVEINSICQAQNIKAVGYVSGDFGSDFGHFKNIIFFRMGGFKSKLSSNNKGFPVSLSDHFERIYNKKEIDVRTKSELPVIGFCGHADISFVKKNKEYLKFLKENIKRFFKKPFRKDYEPLFASAFERAKLLHSFEQSNQVKTNFIYRKNYRAGANTEQERTKTTLEYYDNIKNSDYVVCVRGAGNFSVRLYETLMMGRIPVFVNTDCLLPFDDFIDWKKHVVWVEWEERKKIADVVAKFHQNIEDKDFVKMQIENRKLWKETLSLKKILEFIKNDI